MLGKNACKSACAIRDADFFLVIFSFGGGLRNRESELLIDYDRTNAKSITSCAFLRNYEIAS